METAIINTTKEVTLNVTNHITSNLQNFTNHIINNLPNETINVSVQTGDQWQFLWEAITAIGTIAGAAFTGLTVLQQAKKQDQRNALVIIFNMINNIDHKNAESTLITAYRNNTLYTTILNEDYTKDAEVVWRNYDQLGLLVSKSDLIPKKDDVLDMFGIVIVVFHKILFTEIQRKRSQGEDYFMNNFTRLAIDSYLYWEKKNHIPRDAYTNEPISLEEIDKWKSSIKK